MFGNWYALYALKINYCDFLLQLLEYRFVWCLFMFVDELTSNHKREILAYLHPYLLFQLSSNTRLQFIIYNVQKPLSKWILKIKVVSKLLTFFSPFQLMKVFEKWQHLNWCTTKVHLVAMPFKNLVHYEPNVCLVPACVHCFSSLTSASLYGIFFF